MTGRCVRGPGCLQRPESEWPIQEKGSREKSSAGQNCFTGAHQSASESFVDRMLASCRVKWTSMILVVASIIQFIGTMKKNVHQSNPFVSVNEFREAEEVVCRRIQEEAVSEKELVSEVSSDKMICALRRLIARRGKLSHEYGTNCVVANHQLKEDVKEMAKKVGEAAAEELKVHWHFLGAFSPWMGGAWERLISRGKTNRSGRLKYGESLTSS